MAALFASSKQHKKVSQYDKDHECIWFALMYD
jgi:hypothetical protein